MSFASSRFRQSRRAGGLATAGFLAVSLTLAAAGAAGAASVPNSPFKPLKGDTPDVAVAPDGTGYVVAVQDNTPGNEGLLELCRIPRGIRKCDLKQSFQAAPDGQFLATAPYVFAPNNADVYVVGYEFDSSGVGLKLLRLWRSHNRGASFDGGTTIGTVNPKGDLVFGPGATSFVGVDDVVTAGVDVQSTSFDGSQALGAPVTPAPMNSYSSALTVLPDGSVLLASSSAETCPCGLTVARAAAGANLNDPNAWGVVYSGGTTYARLASGPSGTYLMSYATGNDSWYVQKWNGSTFGKTNKVTTSDDDNRMALRESANGYLYALIQGKSGLTGRPLELFRSHDGVHWTERTLASTNGFEDSFAVANDAGGFAANDTLSYSGSITVTPIPALRAISASAAKGAISGRVSPTGHAFPVALQVKHGKSWVTVRRTTTSKSSGKYSLTLPSVAAGKSIAVRAVATPVEGWAEADGRTFTIK